jgi:8-oxo-dGTP diphosphatase
VTRPTITRSDGARVFACWPAAVLLTIFDRDERLLLLTHPRRRGGWEVPSGAVEAGETVLQAALREAREELGPAPVLRPLGTAHVEMFPYYDASVGDLLSVTYVLACDGGEVVPADDMAGATVRWATLDEIEREALPVIVPAQPWLRRRALELFRLWRDAEVPRLDWRPP